ncbi:superoxide dismutase family protein [Brevibacterium antiquum]
MNKRTLALPALASATLLLAACSAQTSDEGASDNASTSASSAEAKADMQKSDGTAAGTASFGRTKSGTEVSVKVEGLEPGFHGFHVHATGKCEPDSAAADKPEKKGDFLSAGGHMGSDEAKHPNHAGDLPSLLVNEDGTGELSFTTDRFSPEDLADDDGSAVMIHSGTDNFANIPERYASEGADEETAGAGDAKMRVACGVVE